MGGVKKAFSVGRTIKGGGGPFMDKEENFVKKKPLGNRTLGGRGRNKKEEKKFVDLTGLVQEINSVPGDEGIEEKKKAIIRGGRQRFFNREPGELEKFQLRKIRDYPR